MRGIGSDEPTWPLPVFRSVYDQDDNIWWMTPCGHHMNLFDAACSELDETRDVLAAIRELCIESGESAPFVRRILDLIKEQHVIPPSSSEEEPTKSTGSRKYGQ